MNTAVHNIVSTEHNPQCTAHLSVIQIIFMPKPIHEHKYLNVDTDTFLHTLKTLSVGPLHCAVTVNYCCWFKVIVSKIIGDCISNSLMAVKQKEKNELPWPCCSVGGGVMLTTLCCHYTWRMTPSWEGAMLRGGVAEAASTPLLPTVLCNLRTGDTGILGLGILGLSLQLTAVFVCIKTDSKLIV